MTNANDGERLRRALKGHQSSVLRLAYAYLRSTQDAEDVAQDVFLSYYRLAPSFLSEAHEKAWLLRVTINRCKNQLKSAWRTRRAPMPEQLEAASRDETGLLVAVLALPDMYRIPIHLHYYEGYAIKEIAELTNEKSATVGTRLARGRELLRQRIGGIENV